MQAKYDEAIAARNALKLRLKVLEESQQVEAGKLKEELWDAEEAVRMAANDVYKAGEFPKWKIHVGKGSPVKEVLMFALQPDYGKPEPAYAEAASIWGDGICVNYRLYSPEDMQVLAGYLARAAGTGTFKEESI